MSIAGELSFGTYNTRRNLPHRSGRRRGEANFLLSFLKSFMTGAKNGYVFGRDFAIPECGVADCIFFRLEDAAERAAKEHIMAFEAKLSDWRKALSQAYRYRYYADVSIVVMPVNLARRAIENRHLFELFGVGLWTFNPSSGSIRPRIAVKNPKPLSPSKREKALVRIRSAAPQLRKVLEEA
jgi:hypothetical protein